MSSIGNTIWRCVHAWVITTDIVQLCTTEQLLQFLVHIMSRTSILHNACIFTGHDVRSLFFD